AKLHENGTVEEQSETGIACDLLCLAPTLVPANELLHQGGMRFRFEGGRWVPDRVVPGLLAAGAAAGTFGLEAQLREGAERGREAASRRAGEQGSGIRSQESGVRDQESGVGGQWPVSAASGHKRFVCLCEDVTVKDLEQAVAEGFDNIETLKRYATVGMGP